MDVLVIGGGVVGASTAYHLARRGVDTLLVDRADEGRATDAGAGILSPATSSRTADDSWFEFATRAVEYYPGLIDRLEADGHETGYARGGLLAVAVSDDDIDPFEATSDRIEARQGRIGIPAPGTVERLPGREARERFPPLADIRRALAYEDAARVDGRSLARALREAGRGHGLDTAAASAERIDPGERVDIETADGDRYEADAVAIAGGAWSSAFADQLGIEIPVEPQRGQVAHLDCDAETAGWPIVKGFQGHYLVPRPGGRMAVGATRETGSGFDPRTTAGGVREVLTEALRVAPGLADATLSEVRVGLRPASADGRPILGAAPGVENVYLATGHGATGLQLGPYSGKLVAEAIRGAAEPDLGAFSPRRF